MNIHTSSMRSNISARWTDAAGNSNRNFAACSSTSTALGKRRCTPARAASCLSDETRSSRV